MAKVYKALVCCKSGMGSSALLKIKADQVIRENQLPIETEYGNLDSLIYWRGDLVITMDNLADDLRDRVPYVFGIKNITDKKEMKDKLDQFLSFSGKSSS